MGCPRPATIWQEPHSPLPKKNCSPARELPGTALCAAGAFSEAINVVSAVRSSGGKSKAGIPALATPFLMIFSIRRFDISRSCSLAFNAGPWSVPRKSAPWQPAQLCKYSCCACAWCDGADAGRCAHRPLTAIRANTNAIMRGMQSPWSPVNLQRLTFGRLPRRLNCPSP